MCLNISTVQNHSKSSYKKYIVNIYSFQSRLCRFVLILSIYIPTRSRSEMSLNNWCPNNKAHLSSGILQNKTKKNFFLQIFSPGVYNISFLDKDDHNSCVCKFCLFFRKQCFACITFYFCKYFWRKQIVFLYCCWWKKKATVGLKNSK